MDGQGWVNIPDLVGNSGDRFTYDSVMRIVREDPKGRYATRPSPVRQFCTQIRACQGHSVDVSPDLTSLTGDGDLPAILYHGTAASNVQSILQTGLQPQSRTHVHLSNTTDTALSVATRHGVPVILVVDTYTARFYGAEFFLSENMVYLANQIDPRALSVQLCSVNNL